jgi:hypothetical protein
MMDARNWDVDEEEEDRRIRVGHGALTYPNGKVAWNGDYLWSMNGRFIHFVGSNWEHALRMLEICGWDCTDARLQLACPAATHEPPPKPGKAKVLDLVLADLTARAEEGHKKYGTYLETHNGRDSLMDAYQEALDLCMYLRQALEERNDV